MARRIALVLLGAGLALVGCELALRVWRPDIGRRGFADPALGWTSREYADFDPVGGPPKGGRVRLLALGDSYLAGVNVAQMEERFPTYLAAELPDEIEVAVFATAGWGPDQELLAFREKGALWKPDVVLLAFCANNDLINVLSNSHGGRSRKPYFVLGETGELRLFDRHGAPLAWESGASDGAPRGRALGWQSYLFDFLRARAVGLGRAGGATGPAGGAVDPRYTLFDGMDRGTRLLEVAALEPRLSWSPQLGVNDVNAYVHEDFELNAYQWQLLEAILRDLRDRSAEIGAELVVALLPTPYVARDMRLIVGAGTEHRFETPDGPFTFRTDEPRDRLSAICERLSVELFDPTVEFCRFVLAEDLVEHCWPIEGNRHFGRVGHRLLARQLRDFLRERGLLP